MKRCCGTPRGPSEESLARAFLAHSSREAAWELRSVTDDALDELLDQIWELPAVHLSLQVELPKVFSSELDRLCDAVAEDDPHPALLDAVARAIDGPTVRARLARAVVVQAEAGAIRERLASAALIDLASDSRRLLSASLLEAVAVRVGVARTPGGILLAA